MNPNSSQVFLANHTHEKIEASALNYKYMQLYFEDKLVHFQVVTTASVLGLVKILDVGQKSRGPFIEKLTEKFGIPMRKALASKKGAGLTFLYLAGTSLEGYVLSRWNKEAKQLHKDYEDLSQLSLNLVTGPQLNEDEFLKNFSGIIKRKSELSLRSKPYYGIGQGSRRNFEFKSEWKRLLEQRQIRESSFPKPITSKQPDPLLLSQLQQLKSIHLLAKRGQHSATEEMDRLMKVMGFSIDGGAVLLPMITGEESPRASVHQAAQVVDLLPPKFLLLLAALLRGPTFAMVIGVGLVGRPWMNSSQFERHSLTAGKLENIIEECHLLRAQLVLGRCTEAEFSHQLEQLKQTEEIAVLLPEPDKDEILEKALGLTKEGL